MNSEIGAHWSQVFDFCGGKFGGDKNFWASEVVQRLEKENGKTTHDLAEVQKRIAELTHHFQQNKTRVDLMPYCVDFFVSQSDPKCCTAAHGHHINYQSVKIIYAL